MIVKLVIQSNRYSKKRGCNYIKIESIKLNDEFLQIIADSIMLRV